MSVEVELSIGEVLNRWPHIRRFLRVESAGWVDGAFHVWDWWVRDTVERAVGYEEWAGFYQFRLEQRAEELAGDYRKRNLVERWTDDMVYLCRQCAAYARGEDPGEPVPLSVRRPDLEATHRAIVAEIIAEPDTRRRAAGAPIRHLRKAG